MYYGAIKNCDIANGEGVRVSLFVSGCRNHCPGCFQKETLDFNYGKPFTLDTTISLVKMLRPSYIDGLSVLGGEPFEPENEQALVHVLKHIRNELPEKTVWVYTGYEYNNLINRPMMKYIDILVDGRFEEDKKNISLRFRGSENQRIIDVKKSRAAGYKVILYME